MDAFIKKEFDKRLGNFVKVLPEDVTLELSTSKIEIGLRKAALRSEVFDELHLPWTIRGGYLHEAAVELPLGLSLWSEQVGKVTIKDVFLLVGPQEPHWSWEHVLQCKHKLIEVLMQIFEIQPFFMKKNKKKKGGPFASWIDRIKEEAKKMMAGMIEVHIANVHFRYEDTFTQDRPFATGFKMGFMEVHSHQSGKESQERRHAGDWKGAIDTYSDPLFHQDVTCRRMSVYMDLEKDASALIATGPLSGSEVCEHFRSLNRREFLSWSVVRTISRLFPLEHRRRKHLDGPCFRERFDFHKYMVFPAGLRGHVLANTNREATQLQKAPLKDADVTFEPLELAADSEQVRSLNLMLVRWKTFQRRDRLFQTRPKHTIQEYLDALKAVQVKSSSSTSATPRRPGYPEPGPSWVTTQKVKELKGNLATTVHAWWRHALAGVRLECAMPTSGLSEHEVRTRAHIREEYIKAAADRLDALAALKSEPGSHTQTTQAKESEASERMREMQMSVPLLDLLQWRLKARDRHLDRVGTKPDEGAEGTGSAELSPTKSQTAAAVTTPAMPSTMQVKVKLMSFNAYFLIVADASWREALESVQKVPPAGKVSWEAALVPLSPSPMARSWTRQLVLKATVVNVEVDAVQRGRSGHRVARWVELSVGGVSVTNCTANGSTQSARQLLSVAPFRHKPQCNVCFYASLGMFEAKHSHEEPGDPKLYSVLEPSLGVMAHLRELNEEAQQRLLSKLGFLQDMVKDPVGRTLMCGFVRVGQARALDYKPFRDRLIHFLKRGSRIQSSGLVKRPSTDALDRELLLKLQRRVEKLTGKTHMLGSLEAMSDGVRCRQVDQYNSQHVLCREASLAPMRMKVLRSGCPQHFQLQVYQLRRDEDKSVEERMLSALVPPSGQLGVLPWKMGMLLLPKAEFQMCVELDDSRPWKKKLQNDNSFGMPTDDSLPQGHLEKVEPDAPAPGAASTVAGEVLNGSYFLKWGRSGAAKKRFVFFDEGLDAVMWKDTEGDKEPLGAIQLSKVQDICLGIQTPVLLNAKRAKLREDLTWSIVALERTLDLQAETIDERDKWVAALKAAYKRYMQRMGPRSATDGPADASRGILPLPQSIEKRTRKRASYPEKFRSQQCTLRSTYRKLHAVTSLGKTLCSGSLSANQKASSRIIAETTI
eukprot:TRINITY_DN46973_c0_g1_i1.p1 TRINITY_DN46973_c0_g1~~TRINITY_DN46973_c0_g1_i1.p1  ORF type:complete len:1162 (+),score=250.26 TRINITY_DN46973_c0_g1_i1:189-3674(+)